MSAIAAAAWSAIIPLKPPGQRKTRLAGRLTIEQRDRLGLEMLLHVAGILRAVHPIAEVTLLCACAVPGWSAGWIRDQGRGLNAELGAAATSRRRPNLLIVQADLPLLAPADIQELIGGGKTDSSIAPDRHGTGTNALALREGDLSAFAFGEGSFSRHLALARTSLRVVQRIGLSLDVDTPEDLDLAAASVRVRNGGERPREWARSNKTVKFLT